LLCESTQNTGCTKYCTYHDGEFFLPVYIMPLRSHTVIGTGGGSLSETVSSERYINFEREGCEKEKKKRVKAINSPCHGSGTQSFSCLSPRKHGLDTGSLHEGFVVDEVAPQEVLLRVLRVYTLSIIPPELHTHSFIYQRLHEVLTTRHTR
jgi:hypothetical protein